MSKHVDKKGTMNINGVVIPCYVLKDGTRVLEKNGIEKLVETFFKSPDNLLEESALIEIDNFKGYTIEVIMDIYKKAKERNDLVIGNILKAGVAALVDESTGNDNPRSLDYHEYMKEREGMSEEQFSEFDKIMKKALEFNPREKKNPNA